MAGSPPKKLKLCKDIESSSEEDSQSTTSSKKSQEKLSPRHSGSSSQEQTPPTGTPRSPTSPAQIPPKNSQENPQQTPSAGTSEETKEKCPYCGQPVIIKALHLHVLLGLCDGLLGKLTPSAETSRSPISPAQTFTKISQEKLSPIHSGNPSQEQTPSAGTSQAPSSLAGYLSRLAEFTSPAGVITTLIARLRSYQETEQTPSAGTSRTSEEPEELHTCPKCEQSFRSNLCLVYHLLTIHKSGSPLQEQTPSAGTSQSSISPAGDLSMIAKLIAFLETYRQEIEQTPSAGTSRTSEETGDVHKCSKCRQSFKSNLWLAYHLLQTHK